MDHDNCVHLGFGVAVFGQIALDGRVRCDFIVSVAGLHYWRVEVAMVKTESSKGFVKQSHCINFIVN